MQVPNDLTSEPLVQLLMSVQHQTLLLGPFLTLGHQCSIFITLKQARHLHKIDFYYDEVIS